MIARAPQPARAIVVGGSAGALDALRAILPALPGEFTIPIALVVHVQPDKPSYLAHILAGLCALRVKEAEDKEAAAPGTVYLAPPNYHLLIERDRTFSLSVDAPVHYSRPSIDVVFESAADAYGRELVGVLLTGASADGAEGLRTIHQAGGTTVVQSPETAASRTMPEAALRLFTPDQVLPLHAIGPFLAGLSPSAEATKEAP
jgi:two-component system chemotaxis response regulator CheB